MNKDINKHKQQKQPVRTQMNEEERFLKKHRNTKKEKCLKVKEIIEREENNFDRLVRKTQT